MKNVLIWYYTMLFLFAGALLVTGESSDILIELNADDLEARGQLKQLKVNGNDGAIELNDMVLIEDDAPAIGRPEDGEDRSWFERLHNGVMIRKDLVLDDPRAFSGYLLFNGLEIDDNDHPLNISINGNDFVRPPTKHIHPYAKQYYTREWAGDLDNWFFVEIPIGTLKKGTNEIRMWSDSDDMSWEVMVADNDEYKRGSSIRSSHPNRSAKSSDGGDSWDFNKLGWKGMHDGEYCIRLSLDRYAVSGEYISPVIDLAGDQGDDCIKRLLEIRESSISLDMDIPDDCSVEIFTRIGDTPVPSADGWSPYKVIRGTSASMTNPPGRYFQVKAVMKTDNPLMTPSLNGLSIQTKVDYTSPETSIFYRLVDFENGEVIRPSVDFTHEDFEALKEYRERFELDKVVAGARTEFEAQIMLMRWAYKIPIAGLDRYAWNYYDLPKLERGNDGNIKLEEEYTRRRRYGHCLFCNLTLIGACLSMGYPARWVNIATRSTYGHEVTEVWSNDFNKWVFLDATRDYYIYDPDTGIPMNLIEINDRLKEIVPRSPNWEYPIKWVVPSDSLAYDVRIAYREGDNKYSITDIDQGPHLLLLKGQLHTPTRNDFASRQWPVPWRISSNWGGNIFYGFYNEVFPRKREYALHTNRVQDFNYPLNQSVLTVSESGSPGILRVDVDTVTPNFDSFVIRYEEGEWRDISTTQFDWSLHEGLNTLCVRVKNKAGILGPVSKVQVVMNN
ncbi:transglutaminase-like domain-containing protein [Candidatus Latescibacterota bacterium]